MDLHDIKGRIAVALVESVFRRAGFGIEPVTGSASGPEPSRRPGREDFVPDFAARRPAPGEGGEGPERLVVEVRYRPQVGQYLSIEERRGSQSVFVLAKRQWPRLLFVFVTDHPEPGRSCFQLIDLGPWSSGSALRATDLFAHEGLQIFRHNVEEHETLLRRMIALLTGSA